MSVACPKCSYVRSESDTAPAWQCPKCGIAIARYIELQKEAARREADKNAPPPPPPPPHREVFKPDPAFGMLDDIGSSLIRKVLGFILTVITAAVVYFLLSLLRSPQPQTIAPESSSDPTGTWSRAAQHQAGVGRVDSLHPIQTQSPPSAPADSSVPEIAAADPSLPIDVLKPAFVMAHERGDANSAFMVTADITGIPGLDRVRPVSVRVDRRKALGTAGCDRFGVSLTQTTGLHFLYSLNYCVDGSMPAEGRELQVEAQN